MTINLRAVAGAVSYVAGVLFTMRPYRVACYSLRLWSSAWRCRSRFGAQRFGGRGCGEIGCGVRTLGWNLALAWVAGGRLRYAKPRNRRESILGVVVQEQVEQSIRRQLFEKATSVPLDRFERPEYYQKLETGRQALGGHVAGSLDSVAWLIGAFAGAVGLFALYVAAHWLLAVFLVAAAVVASIVRGRGAARLAQVNYHSSPLRREAGYWSGLLSSRETGPELRLFGLADHLIGLWRGVFRRHVAEMDRGRRQVALGFLTQIAVKQVAMLIGAIALVILASAEQISIGQLVALLYGLSRFESVTNTFGWSSATLIEDWSTIAHLRDFLALDSEQRSPVRGAERSPIRFRQGVQLDGLSFTYPGSERPALSGVNLTIRPDEHVALVGETGQAKPHSSGSC